MAHPRDQLDGVCQKPRSRFERHRHWTYVPQVVSTFMREVTRCWKHHPALGLHGVCLLGTLLKLASEPKGKPHGNFGFQKANLTHRKGGFGGGRAGGGEMGGLPEGVQPDRHRRAAAQQRHATQQAD